MNDRTFIQTCPKFHACNAQICPLDPNWRNTKHLKGERVCFYLTESKKVGAEALFGGRGLEELYRSIVEATPDILVRWGGIRYALEEAAKTSSRMKNNPRNGGSHG
jgi:hypothetical protein